MNRADKIAIRAKRVEARRARMAARDARNPAIAVNVAANAISDALNAAINDKNPAIAVNTASTTVSDTTTIPPTTTTTTTKYIALPDLSNRTINIEICIHCFRYQRRLSWMLSSILQQQGDVPNILVNVSHTDDDGTPTTEEVCNFFRAKGLNIKETKVEKDKVSNRAWARNIQATETKADFILFADSDIVYATDLFDDLQKQLKAGLKDVRVVMGADRHSLNDQFCIKYFEEDKRVYPCVVEDVAKIASEFPVKWKRGRDTAPGFFQLVNVVILKEVGGGLITGKAKDHWRNTRGDRALRVRLGGRHGVFTKDMWHLNHDRGGPDIQR